MASQKITQLTALGVTPDGADLIEIVDVSDTTMAATGTNKKITFATLFGAVPSGTGTTNTIVLWTGTNSLGNSNFTQSANSFIPTVAGNLGSATNKFTSAHISTSIIGSTTDFDFNINSGVRMRIKSDGKVAINESTPSAQFEVKGSGATSATASGLFKNSSNTRLLQIYDNGVVVSDFGYSLSNGSGVGSVFLSAYNSSGTYINNSLFLGVSAGASITSATVNTLVGRNAGVSLQSGDANVVLGKDAFFSAVTLGNSAAIGFNSLTNTTSGNNNSAVGSYSLAALVTGGDNTAVGRGTGYSFGLGVDLTTLSNSTLIGVNAGAFASSLTSIIALGRNAAVNTSNEFAIGSSTDYINTTYLGAGGKSNTAFNTVLKATPIAAGNTDIAGASFTIAGGQSTGNANGGSVIFQTSPSGASGSSVNALVTQMTVKSTGVINMANLPTSATGLVSGDLWNNSGVINIV